MQSDRELIQKPLSIDLLVRLSEADGCTKSELMRSYHDLMAKTAYYRLCEMTDLGWIKYRSEPGARNRVCITDKGRDVCETVTDMLEYMEEM